MMKRVALLGVQVDLVTIADLQAVIASAVAGREQCIIANHNTHSVYLYHRDPKMRRFYEQASCTHVDGMALVLIGKLLGLPMRREHRVTYVDWVHHLMGDAATNALRIFYLGSRPDIGERGAGRLRRDFPALQIATHHGYFDPTGPSNEEVLASIADYRPHIIMVGMGMPRQEHWILDNLDRLEANVILPAGACMDYLAGAIPTPPRWLGPLGLEWLHRFLAEPGRLWRRYLVEPWFVLGLLVSDLKSRATRSRSRRST